MKVMLIAAMFFSWPREQYEKCVIMLEKSAKQFGNNVLFKKSMQCTEKLYTWIEDQQQCHFPYLFLIISNTSLICDKSINSKFVIFQGEKFEGFEVL